MKSDMVVVRYVMNGPEEKTLAFQWKGDAQGLLEMRVCEEVSATEFPEELAPLTMKVDDSRYGSPPQKVPTTKELMQHRGITKLSYEIDGQVVKLF